MHRFSLELPVELGWPASLRFPSTFPIPPLSPGPSVDADNNRKEYLENFGMKWM